ncbi:MAG: hypothetical protein QOE26_2103 [Verrucomicrobiota bacterium]|jgi:hypothetical protein
MASRDEIQKAVLEELKFVPFDKPTLNSPFNDFWKQVNDQDERTGRGVRRVDIFLLHLKAALGPFDVSRDDLIDGSFAKVSNLIDEIEGN